MKKNLHRSLVRLGAVSLLLLWPLVIGCHAPAQESPGTPSILLITLDTLRADRLGSYGYSRPTSPHLDAFGERATLYRQAWASAPWTLPSHASLFTGLYPFEHGARTYRVGGRGVGLDEKPIAHVSNAKPLPQDAVTIAERLRDAGYQTAAIIANDAYLTRFYGLWQGFDDYDVRREYADDVNERVFAWLQARDDRPFFLFVNYMDTHDPYNCTPVPEFIEPAPGPDSSAVLDLLTAAILPADGRAVSQPLLQELSNQYDAAVHNLDREIGKLLAYLETEGLFENIVILITSDHGEYFGEHRLIEHNKDLYEPALAIPFLLKDVGQREGRVVDEPVSHVHVPGILARRTDALSVDDFPHSWPEPVILAENHYTRLLTLAGPGGHRFQRSRLAIYDGEHKYIHSTDGAFELFNLAHDPAEQRNLIHERPEVRKRLASRLRDIVSARFHDLDAFDEGELSREELELPPYLMEQLRSLGYL